MGINGLYAELGPGERISLAKLADDHLQSTGRLLRIAIDVSIWSFQAKSAQGGTNPALRTLYYRLARLLSLPIQPLFVFDGPHRPQFKRHRRTATVPGYITSRQKTLISLFGFSYHTAPGEAEAECAHLQKLGVVDATLSEDVDTLMFGCGKVLRNWSGEKGNGAVPTHVTVYDLDKVEKEKGLSPEGMIMVALMSGGDYIPAGVPGCGIRIAVDAARAGFGKELCSLGREGDEQGLREWRERFTHELRTNEHKLFARRNNKIVIPKTFPDKQVLGYYLHPAVSGVRDEIVVDGPQWGGEVDWRGLRRFVSEHFEWNGKGGAKKLMRTLAAGVLVARLLRGLTAGREDKDVEFLVEKISQKRVHHSTDGLSELRVAYIPANVVPIDLAAEPDDDAAGALGMDDYEEDVDVVSGDEQGQGVKRKSKEYDPFAVERGWILERILQLGVRELVQEWEDGSNKPKKKATATAIATATATATATVKAKAPSAGPKRMEKKTMEKDAGAIERYLKISKPTASASAPAPASAVPAKLSAVDLDDDEWWIPPPLPRRGTAPLMSSKTQFKPSPAPTTNAPRVVSNPTVLAMKQSKIPSSKTKANSNSVAVPEPTTKQATKRASKPSARDPVAGSPPVCLAENPWSLAAKRPTAPARANTGGIVEAPAPGRGKPEVKSRSVSGNLPSSPLPPPSKILSQNKGKPLHKASSSCLVPDELDELLPRGLFNSNKKTSSKLQDSQYRPEASRPKSYAIPSSPPVENYFPDVPSSPDWPSPVHLHGVKKQRKPSSQIEVIDLSSSPAACFSATTSPITHNWAPGSAQEPSSPLSEIPSCNIKHGSCEGSPGKKIKTPENIRRVPTPEDTSCSVNHNSSSQLRKSYILPAEDTSYDYDEGHSPFGYDDHFGYYEQDSSDLIEDHASRLEAIGKVNRVLEFSAPPPPPVDETRGFFSQPLTYLPQLDTNMQSLGYTHSRNSSTASTASSLALSDFSIPLSTPTTEPPLVRDYSWITTTRGNYSPRKQLKRVMEGVFPSPSSDSPLEIFKPEKTKQELPAANLSPVEALHEIMHAPTHISAPSSPPKEYQQFSWVRPGSRASRTSDGSVTSSVSLGPGFDERIASAPVIPDQKTPPRRRVKSMIPIPSTKKNKPQAVSPPVAATIKAPRPKPQQQQKLTEKMGKVKKASSSAHLAKPTPTTNSTTNPTTSTIKPPKLDTGIVAPKTKKLTVRQSLDSGLWKEFEAELGPMQTIGRKGGLNVKRSLGKINNVWEDVDVVDLTGE